MSLAQAGSVLRACFQVTLTTEPESASKSWDRVAGPMSTAWYVYGVRARLYSVTPPRGVDDPTCHGPMFSPSSYST